MKKLIVKKCTAKDIAEYTAAVTNVKTSSKLRVEGNVQIKYLPNEIKEMSVFKRFKKFEKFIQRQNLSLLTIDNV